MFLLPLVGVTLEEIFAEALKFGGNVCIKTHVHLMVDGDHHEDLFNKNDTSSKREVF